MIDLADMLGSVGQPLQLGRLFLPRSRHP
jgi:hypothetical protein